MRRPAARSILIGLLAVCAFVLWGGRSASQSRRLIIIFVVDGLRPDSINGTDTPTIARLRRDGVDYVNSHSIFPTVTRVNAAALATGTYPALNGIVGNSMFVGGVNERGPFDTGDYKQLLRLEEVAGRAVTVETLGERLQRRGRKLVTVSSGSTGSGFLLNPTARRGSGVVIHGLFDEGTTAAYPKEISDVVLQRFGSPPPDPDDLGQMHWTDKVLRDYVLPDLRPDVVIDWMGPLDSSQHAHGSGSPEAVEALHQIDDSLAQTLTKLDTLGLLDQTNIIITSDHGFAQHVDGVNVVDALITAGLKRARDSTDVVVASQGQSILFYVPSAANGQIEKLVRFLQQQPWIDVMFTREGRGGHGSIAGTFSFDLIDASHSSRSADVIASLKWTSSPNPYGMPGTHTIHSASTGPISSGASGHGGLNPWVVHNTFVAWGADFKKAARVEAPVSMADIAPTVLTVLGIGGPSGGRGRGRVLRELLKDGPAVASVRTTRRVVRVSAGSFQTAVEVSTVAGHDYVDSGSRQR